MSPEGFQRRYPQTSHFQHAETVSKFIILSCIALYTSRMTQSYIHVTKQVSNHRYNFQQFKTRVNHSDKWFLTSLILDITD